MSSSSENNHPIEPSKASSQSNSTDAVFPLGEVTQNNNTKLKEVSDSPKSEPTKLQLNITEFNIMLDDSWFLIDFRHFAINGTNFTIRKFFKF